MKKVVWAFFAIALISIPAHADKWAVGTYHTSQPIDQVFEKTVKMIETKRWYITRVRSQIQLIDREQRTVHATYVGFGKEWGDIYVSMATQENATSIKAVVRLRSDATLHAANYAHSFGNELKKLFPDLNYDIQRDVVPGNFGLGVGQVSIPLVAADAPVVQPLQNPTVNPGTTVTQQPMPLVIDTAPAAQPMQNSVGNQQQQMGAAMLQLGNSLTTTGTLMEIRAAREKQQVDENTARNAVTQFLSNANPMMNRYLATSGREAVGQFEITAQAITKARNDAYVTLTDPSQKDMFNRASNKYMLAFGKQMGDHVSQQTSANREREIDEEQYTDNLHRALDSWYANDKDWRKIPAEMWNKLSERDKGRLKDGIDPETINTRTPHPDHSPQP